MKLFNVTVSYDIYIAATSKEDAQSTALDIIKEAAEPPFDIGTYELRDVRDVPARVHDQCPYVSPTVKNYDPIPEDTVIVLQRRIYAG
jgi:hypothetical protein